MKFEYRIDVVNDAKTTQETINLVITVGSLVFSANMLPRDAAEIGRTLTEAARVATTGVIRPTPAETGRIIQ